MKILLAEAIPSHRFCQTLKSRQIPGRVNQVNVATPFFELRQSAVTRQVTVGDVVDVAAERVYFEHRLPLGAREDAHGKIKRTATRPLCGRRMAICNICALCRHGTWYRRADVTVLSKRCKPACIPLPRAVAVASILVRCT